MSWLPHSPNVVFFFHDDNSYRSEDCGRSVTQVTGESKGIKDLVQNPHDPNLVLGSNFETCHKREKDCVRRKQLFLSTNKGKTWVLIKPFVYFYSWLKVSKQSPFENSAILVLKQDDELSHQPEFLDGLRSTRGNSLHMSASYFRDEQLVLSDVVDVSIQGTEIFVQHSIGGTQRVFSVADLLRSTQLVWNQLRLEGRPFRDHQLRPVYTNSFNSPVVSVSSQIIYVGTYSQGDGSLMTDLFVPKTSNLDLKVGVHNIQLSFSSRRVNFQKIHLTEGGFYLANKFDSSIIKLNKGLPPDRKMDLSTFVQTKFSSDRGLNWQEIPIPALLSQTDRQFCELAASCRLHVHLFRNKGIPGVYSKKSSPGIVLANGNLGSYLSWRNKDLSSYASEDAGLTWRQVSVRPGVFAYAKQGILVFAVARSRTSLISYSWDLGRNWITRQFVDGKGIFIRKIMARVHASQQEGAVLAVKIMGATSNKRYGISQANGILINLELKISSETRHCQGLDAIGTNLKSDYEHYYPSSSLNNECRL